ncbi:hypothetical protein BC938DRAFT_483470 [Jimgerdemannia flammicorona]|uniref:Uncharacterized protein n=1 Tax=Jimgerdemannia flammicorona TaxID=994334 RepID=A0A433QBZ3_9FUNG|nr:hypothetical protein BC938DRAFT_483470 [Jimgerdemannia flammicorona]
MLILGITMTVVIYSQSSVWISTIQNAIETAEIDAFRSIAISRAAIVQSILNGFHGDNILASTYAVELFRADLPDELPLNVDIPLVDPPKPTVNQQAFYSAYFNVNITTTAQLNASTVTATKSTVLDNVMRALLINKASFQTIYAGFADFGFRRYPYLFDDAKRTQTVCNVPYAPSELQNKQGFIPACRLWYQEAVTAAAPSVINNGLGPTKFSTFVSSVTKSVAATTSQAFFTSAGLLGVMAIETDMVDVNAALARSPVLNNGYTFMVDTNGTLIV